MRKIPYNVRKDLNEYLDEMENAGVITKLTLEDEHAGKWISNLVITKKKWDEKKIRVNLDTRHMEDAIIKSSWNIPTMEELRHEFEGSDRFSVLDLNHAFLQFELNEDAKELFTFQTPKGGQGICQKFPADRTVQSSVLESYRWFNIC